MSQQSFEFHKYISNIEKLMIDWYNLNSLTFSHPTNLGSAREHFIGDVLTKFLPESVVVGSGEIIGGGKRSGQQDLIIYRSDFPVITGFGSVNTYLADGVIATIEVKSDLTTGNPNGLTGAFSNIKKVLELGYQAAKTKGTDE